jgi:hypothetical protein
VIDWFDEIGSNIVARLPKGNLDNHASAFMRRTHIGDGNSDATSGGDAQQRAIVRGIENDDAGVEATRRRSHRRARLIKALGAKIWKRYGTALAAGFRANAQVKPTSNTTVASQNDSLRFTLPWAGEGG